MKTLKDLFKEQSKEKDKIEKFIMEQLKPINEKFFGEDDILNNWKVEVSENEFIIYFYFGNIDFEDILQIANIFKEYGFSLDSISDNYRIKRKGLVFYFSVNNIIKQKSGYGE